MTSVVSALGTLLKIGDGASPSEAFTTIAECRNITGPSLSMEFIDVTNHDSANNFREFLASFKNAGDVNFELNFLPDNATQGFGATGLIKDFNDRTLRNFQLLFPDSGATLVAFAAYVANFEPQAPIDGQMAASVTLRISGAATWS